MRVDSRIRPTIPTIAQVLKLLRAGRNMKEFVHPFLFDEK